MNDFDNLIADQAAKKMMGIAERLKFLETIGVSLNNVEAVTDPTVSDGILKGYSKDSFWHNTADGTVFVCTDPAEGAAAWSQISYPDFTSDAQSNPDKPLKSDSDGKVILSSASIGVVQHNVESILTYSITSNNMVQIKTNIDVDSGIIFFFKLQGYNLDVSGSLIDSIGGGYAIVGTGTIIRDVVIDRSPSFSMLFYESSDDFVCIEGTSSSANLLHSQISIDAQARIVNTDNQFQVEVTEYTKSSTRY